MSVFAWPNVRGEAGQRRGTRPREGTGLYALRGPGATPLGLASTDQLWYRCRSAQDRFEVEGQTTSVVSCADGFWRENADNAGQCAVVLLPKREERSCSLEALPSHLEFSGWA